MVVPLKDKKGVTITNPFQKLLEIKVHNFTIDQLNQRCKIMIQKFIQYIMREYLCCRKTYKI